MAKEKNEFPMTVEKGNSRVKIYHCQRGEYHEYKVAFFANGARRTQTFSDFKDAKHKADEVNESVNAGQIETLSLSRSQFQEYSQAVEMLAGTGLSLPVAIMQLTEAKKILGTVSLIEAAEFHKSHYRKVTAKPTGEIVKEFLQAKKFKGICEEGLRGLKGKLARFSDTFRTDLAAVTAADIAQFLNTIPKTHWKQRRISSYSARTYNGYREAIGALVKFATRKKYLPPDWSEFQEIEVRKLPVDKIEIWTPTELARLLNACPLGGNRGTPMLRPFLAIAAFAGLRTAEILRLRWEQVGVGKDAKYIEVKAENAKTRGRRLVPMSDNLKAWLAPHMKTEGPIWPHKESALIHTRARLAKKVGIEWRHNASRHSFISYRIALTSDVASVSLEAGNSPQMIFRHYREVVTPEAAADWFSIMPGDASDKITYLKTASIS